MSTLNIAIAGAATEAPPARTTLAGQNRQTNAYA
jgi:hypothetical protein